MLETLWPVLLHHHPCTSPTPPTSTRFYEAAQCGLFLALWHCHKSHLTGLRLLRGSFSWSWGRVWSTKCLLGEVPVKKRGRKQGWADVELRCWDEVEQISAACQGIPEQSLPLREVLSWVEMMKFFAALPCWVIVWSVLRKTWPWLPSNWWVATATIHWEKCDLVSHAEVDCETANSWRGSVSYNPHSWTGSPFVMGDLSGAFLCLP